MKTRGSVTELQAQLVSQFGGKSLLEVILPNEKTVTLDDIDLPPERIDTLTARLYHDLFLQIEVRDRLTGKIQKTYIPLSQLPSD